MRRRSVLMTLILAVVLSTLTPPAEVRAEDPAKPLVIISFSSYDRLVENLERVGEISDRPLLPTQFELTLWMMTGGQGAAGLDKTRPWGVVILAGDEGQDIDDVTGYAVLPVTDLDKLLKVAQPFVGEPEEVDGGLLKFSRGEDGWFFVREAVQCAILGFSADAVLAAPDDPLPLLADLGEQYDSAICLSPSNAPASQRAQLIEMIERAVKARWEQLPNETDREFAVRTEIGKRLLNALFDAINDLERITIGARLNHDKKTVCLDLSATALPNTPTAARLAVLESQPSKFAGRLPETMLAFNWVGDYPPPTDEELEVLFGTINARLGLEIDKRESGQRAEAGKRLVAGLLDVVKQTMATGRDEGALSLVSGPETLTLLAAVHVADGQQLEDALGAVVEAARREHGDFVNSVLTTNADEHNGVRFHRISIPLPDNADDREQTAQLIGETIELVIGIGPHAGYLAVGRDPGETLKQMLDLCEAAADESTRPLEFTLCMAKVAELMALFRPAEGEGRAEKVAALLAETEDQAHLRITLDPLDRGVSLRLELEQGVFKLMDAVQGD